MKKRDKNALSETLYTVGLQQHNNNVLKALFYKFTLKGAWGPHRRRK